VKTRGLLQSLGVRGRVMILAIAPLALVVALLGYNMASSRLDDAEQNLAERGALMARHLALASEFALFSQNIPLVNETLQRIAVEPEVNWSAVWDNYRGAMISHGISREEPEIRVLVNALRHEQMPPAGFYAAPIQVGLAEVTDFSGEFGSVATDAAGQLLGFAIVEMSRDGLVKRQTAIVRSSLLVALGGLVASVLLALLIGNSITKPVLGVLRAVHALQGGDLAARVRPRAGGEIGSLEQGVNKMAETLQVSQQDLQQRVEEATSALRHTVVELELRNRELELARELALEAGQERTEFLARMSHEIRTPLNAVVGFAKLLNADIDGSYNVEYVRTIQTAAEQLLHVINDILQFIRLDAGADQLEEMPFNVGEALEDVVAMLGPMANEKGLELVLLLHGDLPQTLHGDLARVSQIVVNLVNNAIKFTAEGQVVVEASCPQDDGDVRQVEISVKDTGIGLDPLEKDRIFSAFSQADSSITRRFGGTGLGLSIARRLVELMEGEMGVEGQKGQGAHFWVRLPCREPSAPAPTDVSGPLAGQRLLVYDLNPFVRRSLRSTLAVCDVRVFNTGRWEKVMQMIASHHSHQPYDAVVVGLSQRESQPDAVERYLRELRAHHRGFVLLLTGSENWMPSDAVRASAPLDWATKPVRRATLQRLLGERTGEPAALPQRTTIQEPTCRLLGLHILVAEDNEFNRQLLRHVLESQGAIVDEVLTGAAAVRQSTPGTYDVILMDLHMPEVDGAEAASQIRAALGAASPPIWALTADVFGRSDLAGTDENFDDWLLKPIDPELLANRLATLKRQGLESAAGSGLLPSATATVPPELCERYRHEMTDLILQLRRALADPDPTAAAGLVHNLKGIVGLFGGAQQTEIATRLSAEYSRGNTEAVLGLLDELQGCIEPA